MKKTRRKFAREFKLSVLRELESGKSMAQVCCENDIRATSRVQETVSSRQFLEWI